VRRRVHPSAAVGAHDDVRVEQGGEPVDVPLGGRGGERLDDLPLLLPARRVPRPVLGDVPAGAGGELADAPRRPADDAGDLVEGEAEDVVQDERRPLGPGRGTRGRRAARG
jgi:hypothetical protein